MVHPDVANSGKVAGILKATLYNGMFDDGSSFILPVTHPEPDKNPSWYDGWMDIIKVAQKRWVSAVKNDLAYCYEAKLVKDVGEPDWSDAPIDQCLEIAFSKKHIDSADHGAIAVISNKPSPRINYDHQQY